MSFSDFIQMKNSMSQSEKPKRDRKANFTQKETAVLVEKIRENKSIVCCKKADTSSVELKRIIWDAITKEVSSVTEAGRNKMELCKKWHDLKGAVTYFLANKHTGKVNPERPPPFLDIIVKILGISEDGEDSNAEAADASQGNSSTFSGGTAVLLQEFFPGKKEKEDDVPATGGFEIICEDVDSADVEDEISEGVDEDSNHHNSSGSAQIQIQGGSVRSQSQSQNQTSNHSQIRSILSHTIQQGGHFSRKRPIIDESLLFPSSTSKVGHLRRPSPRKQSRINQRLRQVQATDHGNDSVIEKTFHIPDGTSEIPVDFDPASGDTNTVILKLKRKQTENANKFGPGGGDAMWDKWLESEISVNDKKIECMDIYKHVMQLKRKKLELEVLNLQDARKQ